MTGTRPQFKLSLLKYGGILYIGGILLVLLYIIGFERLSLLFEDTLSLVIVTAALIILGVVSVYFGSTCTNLYRAVKEVSEPFVIEDIDFTRSKVTVRDDKARVYTIKFKRRGSSRRFPFYWFESSDTRDETGYYEAWTPLRRSPKNGSLPWFVKVIKKDETLILLSTLSKKTVMSQLNERLTALGKLAHDIDLWGYGEGNP